MGVSPGGGILQGCSGHHSTLFCMHSLCCHCPLLQMCQHQAVALQTMDIEKRMDFVEALMCGVGNCGQKELAALLFKAYMEVFDELKMKDLSAELAELLFKHLKGCVDAHMENIKRNEVAGLTQMWSHGKGQSNLDHGLL